MSLDIFDKIKADILECFCNTFKINLDKNQATHNHLDPKLDNPNKLGNALINFTVEFPKDRSHGDFATNIAMTTSKYIAKKPIEIATELIQNLTKSYDYITSASVAGVGFININVKKEVFYPFLMQVITNGEKYGFSNYGKDEKINVEYASPNPTGPVHLGHTRGAIYGDILSELLSKNGYKVTREYYINDAGVQIEHLIRSVKIRIEQQKGKNIELDSKCYPGEYLIDLAQQAILQNISEQNLENFVIEQMLVSIKKSLSRLKINHDCYTSERDIVKNGYVEKCLDILTQKNLIYKGVTEKPKGKSNEDWEESEQTLFKSTNFGDSEDRVLLKSDGTKTYFANDIAYHLHKLERGYKKLILAIGADHLGYVKRIESATRSMLDDSAALEFDIKICQLVKFVKNGEQVKMSKRKGTFETLDDVLDEVDPDIIRFIMLTKKNDISMDFDLEKVKEQTKENPIFYIQYAFSRASSVIRQAKELSLNLTITQDDLSNLTHQDEITFLKKLLEYPSIMRASVKLKEPHHLAFYLYDLASLFHKIWTNGNENPNYKFILQDKTNLTKSRMYVPMSFVNVVSSCLKIFKITPLQKM